VTTLEDRPVASADDARRLICELGRRFYALGWVSGTALSAAIRSHP
jgi:hypothetical protein